VCVCVCVCVCVFVRVCMRTSGIYGRVIWFVSRGVDAGKIEGAQELLIDNFIFFFCLENCLCIVGGCCCLACLDEEFVFEGLTRGGQLFERLEARGRKG
jgi:hypothetical protein